MNDTEFSFLTAWYERKQERMQPPLRSCRAAQYFGSVNHSGDVSDPHALDPQWARDQEKTVAPDNLLLPGGHCAWGEEEEKTVMFREEGLLFKNWLYDFQFLEFSSIHTVLSIRSLILEVDQIPKNKGPNHLNLKSIFGKVPLCLFLSHSWGLQNGHCVWWEVPI